MSSLLSVLFGCRHSRTTFPLTPLPTDGIRRRRRKDPTYVSCLDCGLEIPYSWAIMRACPRKHESRIQRLLRKTIESAKGSPAGSAEYQPEFEIFTR